MECRVPELFPCPNSPALACIPRQSLGNKGLPGFIGGPCVPHIRKRGFMFPTLAKNPVKGNENRHPLVVPAVHEHLLSFCSGHCIGETRQIIHPRRGELNWDVHVLHAESTHSAGFVR